MKKGFTLIELLAVIVILAIIALIATPIIINIINDARESSNKRSIELYAASVKNAVAKAQLNTGVEVPAGSISSEILQSVEYNGESISCETYKLYSDGSIYLGGCTLGAGTKKYTYGKDKPLYYGNYSFSGTIGSTNVPEESQRLTTPPQRSTIPPSSYPFYLGYDVANGEISAAYVCFVRNGAEYCLKGYDTDLYDTNVEILKTAYADIVDTNCSSGDTGYVCTTAEFGVGVNLNGSTSVGASYAGCSTPRVNGDGTFGCRTH